MSTFHLEIVVPDRAFCSEEVQELVLRTPGGEIGILRGHIPMVVAVSTGLAGIKKNGHWSYAFISEGFMEVTADHVVVLADSAEWPDEIDLERAKAAEENARKRLGARRPDAAESISAKSALQRALWRQKAAEKRNG